MKTLFYCIGIDVDKTSFKTSLMVRMDPSYQIKASRTFGNTNSGYRDLIIWVEKLAFYLHSKGQKVHVVLATKARRYIQSLGIRSKNDKIDAQGLASMGLQQPLEEWKPCSKNIYQLRSLTRQLEVLQEARTNFLNQL